MLARWLTFVLWAAVAASGVAWGLRLFVAAAPAPRDARVVDASQALRGEVARVLGADAAPPAAAEASEAAGPAPDPRFQLLGVVAPRPAKPARAGRDPHPSHPSHQSHESRAGVALIVVDGKPARAFRVGAKVDEDIVLKSVRMRGAELGPRDGAPTVSLEIAPPPPAATGVLPPPPGAVPVGRAVPPPSARLPVRPPPPAWAMPQSVVPPPPMALPPPGVQSHSMPGVNLAPGQVPHEAAQTR